MLQFLAARLDEGFCFPFNPKWLLCDAGWWQLYEKAERSADAAASLDAWFPPRSGVREAIAHVRAAHPEGFRPSGEAGLVQHMKRGEAELYLQRHRRAPRSRR